MKTKLPILSKLVLLSALVFFGSFSLNAQDYCTPTFTIVDEYITKVELGDINNETPAKPATVADCYTYFNGQSTDMYLGSTYPIKVTVSGYTTDAVEVWIDYNQNKTFEETEMISLAQTKGIVNFSGDITIPADATLGETRMRIMVRYNNSSGNLTPAPCGPLKYGEAEDYDVNITELTTAISDFTYAPEEIGVGDPVTFTDASMGVTASWKWIFGANASQETLTGQGPHTVTFSTVGEHPVKLIVGNGSGQFDSIIKTVTVIEGSAAFAKPKFFSANVNYNDVVLSWFAPDEVVPIADVEGFEGALFPPAGWEVKKSTTLDGAQTAPEEGKTWKTRSDMPIYINSGINGAFIQDNVKDFSWLITPEIEVNTGDKLHYHMRFKKTNYFKSKMHIMVYDGAWSELKFYGAKDTLIAMELEQVIDLAAYAGKTIKLGFVHEYTGGFPVAIDDVSISSSKSRSSNITKVDVSGYKITRDGEDLVTLEADARNYIDSILPAGEHTYTICALYGSNRSFITPLTVTTKALEVTIMTDKDEAYLGDTIVCKVSVKGSYKGSLTWDFDDGTPTPANTDDLDSCIVVYNTLGEKTIKITIDTLEVTKKVTIYPGSPDLASPEGLAASAILKDIQLSWQGLTLVDKMFEGFEAGMPADWEVKYSEKFIDDAAFELINPIDTNPLHKWSINPSTVHSGNNAIFIGYAAKEYNWLITPEMEIVDGDILEFWMRYKSTITYHTLFRVMVFSDNQWHQELFFDETSPTNEYATPVSINLSKYNGKTVKIAFVHEYNNGYNMALDDIRIRGNGPVPANFVKYNIYRNDEILTSISDALVTTYADVVPTGGKYKYYITAVYNEGEAAPVDVVYVDAQDLYDLPYEEDFEGVVEDFIFETGEYVWKLGETADFSNADFTFPERAGTYVGVNLTGAPTFPTTEGLITAPPMRFNVDGRVVVKFSYFSETQKFSLKIKDSTAANWVVLEELPQTDGEWKDVEIVFPEDHKFDGAQLGFYFANGYNWKKGVAFDDFRVEHFEGKHIEVLYNGEDAVLNDVVTSLPLNKENLINLEVISIGSENVKFADISLDGSGSDKYSIDSKPDVDSVIGYLDTAVVVVKFESTEVDGFENTLTINTDAVSSPDDIGLYVFAGNAWTYMIYMKEDSTLNGLKDLNELEVIGSIPEKVSYVCLYDAIDDTQDGVYLIEKDENNANTLVSEKITNKFSTDLDAKKWQTLQEFTLWAADSFPARRYGLNIWSRGDSIMPVWDVEKALKDFADSVGTDYGFDVLGLDITSSDFCWAGQLEVAFQLQKCALCVISSEKTQAETGWNYTTAFSKLNDNPNIEMVDMVKEIVNSYYDANQVMPSAQSVVLSSLLYGSGTPEIDEFAEVMIENMYLNVNLVKEAINEAWKCDDNPEFVDFGHFLNLLLAKDLQGDDIKAKIQTLIDWNNSFVYYNKTNELENATGAKVWLATNIMANANHETYLDSSQYMIFGSVSKWGAFLKELENPRFLAIDFNVDNDSVILNYPVALMQSIEANPAADSVVWKITPNTYTLEAGAALTDDTLNVKFTQAGKYSIQLYAANEVAVDSLLKTDLITVVDTPMIVDFEADTVVYQKAIVDINNKIISIDPVTSYTWAITPATFEFVEGTDANSENVKVKFTETGRYTVALTANNGTEITETKTDYIRVMETELTVDFEVSATNIYTTQTALLTSACQAIPEIESYEWVITPATYEVVGGGAANTKNVNIKFKAAGDYTVELIVNNGIESKNLVKTDVIKVKDATLNADFAADIANPYATQEVLFTSTVTSDPEAVTYSWIIEPDDYTLVNSSSVSSENLNVKFDSAGTYTVKLALDNGVVKDTVEKTIEVKASSLTVDFSTENHEPYINEMVTITSDIASDPEGSVTYTWAITPGTFEFLEGTTANSKDIKVKFTEDGEYDISLTANNTYLEVVETKTGFINAIDTVVDAPENLVANYDAETHLVDLTWDEFGPAPTNGIDEGFEGATFPPEGWEVKHSTTLDGDLGEPTATGPGQFWVQVNATSFGGAEYIHSGDYAAGLGYDAPEFNWLITPEVPVDGSTSLKFWVWYTNSANYTTNFRVMVFADDAWNEALFYTAGTPTNAYESEVEVSLADYAGKNVRVAFVYEFTDGYQLTLDDVKIGSSKTSYRGGDFVAFKVYRNNEVIAENITSPSYQDDLSNAAAGEYTYKVTAIWNNPTAQESDPSNEVKVNHTISITDYNLSKMKLYPNPNNGAFVIDLGNVEDAEWSLIDVNGKVIETNKAEKAQIKVNNVPAGLYYIEVKAEGTTKTFKVVVE